MDLADTVAEIQNEEIFSIPVPSDGILEEPIEILVQLAKSGEIDPWNIDIVDVTDKFLRIIDEMEVMDLRISGRTLHYAAILVRMKSEYLVETDTDDDYEVEDDYDIFNDFNVTDYPIPHPPIRRISTRPVTLNELIEELTKAEMISDKRRGRKESQVRKRVNMTTEEVMEMAHDEYIESSMALVQESLNDMFKNKELILFSDLLCVLPDKVITFISLLFLANRREIWLEQEELFGELYIRPWSLECLHREMGGEIFN